MKIIKDKILRLEELSMVSSIIIDRTLISEFFFILNKLRILYRANKQAFTEEDINKIKVIKQKINPIKKVQCLKCGKEISLGVLEIFMMNCLCRGCDNDVFNDMFERSMYPYEDIEHEIDDVYLPVEDTDTSQDEDTDCDDDYERKEREECINRYIEEVLKPWWEEIYGAEDSWPE